MPSEDSQTSQHPSLKVVVTVTRMHGNRLPARNRIR